MKWMTILSILVAHLYVDLTQNSLPIIFPHLRNVFHLSYAQIGLLVTVMNVTSSIIQPIFGYIHDRLQSNWMIAMGIVWTALFIGLVGAMPSYWLLLVCTGAAGIGTAAFHPAASLATSAASGSRKAFGMSFFALGGNIGFAVGPMVAGFLVYLMGLKGTILLLGPGIIVALWVYRQRGDFTQPVSAQGAQTSRPPLTTTQIVSLSALSAVVIVRSWAIVSLIVFLPLYFAEQGISTGVSSLLLFSFLGAGAVAGFLGGHYSDRFGRRKFVILPLLAYVPVMMFYLSRNEASNSPFSIFLLVCVGALLLSSFSVTLVMAQEVLPQSPGFASGLTLGLSFGLGGLGVSVVGAFADAYSLPSALWLLAIAPAPAAFFTLFVRKEEETAIIRKPLGAEAGG